jgi:hypothetical protein
LNDLSRGTTVSVSDGSHYSNTQQAAGAWIVESECRTQWIMGSMLVPGPKAEHNSYRSELTGLLGISATIRILASGQPLATRCIIGCDGEAALKSVVMPRHRISSNSSNADILSAICDIWTSTHIRPVPVHIKGHQDSTGRPLTRLEEMNTYMDALAKATARCFQPREDNSSIARIGIGSLWHKHTQITGEVSQLLYLKIEATYYTKYLETRVLQLPSTSANICWEAMKYARARTSTNMNIFISKWISDTVPTGVVMQRRQHRIFNRCPRCNHWGEDRRHILICWDSRADLIWKTHLQRLHEMLVAEHTKNDIMEFIMDGLRQFKRSVSGTQHTYHVQWQQEQANLGWFNFLTGFVSKELVAYQQQYYNAIGSTRKGSSWAGKVIIRGWNLMHAMWIGRNDILHQKSIINSLAGETLLDIEIEREYDAGYATLPQTAHKWFRQSKDQLLQASVEQKKGWLLIIRSIKEAMKIADYSIFSSSKALRTWVGLQTQTN